VLPFDDSRRLTGSNLFFASPGAVLEVVGLPVDDQLLSAWRERTGRARARLGWHTPGVVARVHASGASLAIAAPCDLLFLATEVNEWAWCASVLERDPLRWRGVEEALRAAAVAEAQEPATVLPPVLDESAALRRFEQLAEREIRPALRALLAEGAARDLPYLLDDTELTLGAGRGGRSFPLGALPRAADVPWDALHDIPTVVVTGSNGKTTTVRLLAACARAHGWQAAYNCTDGVYIDHESLARGDYSGPAGTRRVLREQRCEAAMLETARGGILRRGIAVSQAHAAVVTNVSSDHFGEYGIHDLDGLTDVKLSVAAVVRPGGLLVLNAEDAQLRAKAPHLARRFGASPNLGWFALDADTELLRTHRAQSGHTCGVRDGRLVLANGRGEHDLGAVGAMPLTIGGYARYNVANLAGAALAASALGIPATTIAAVCARFGAEVDDNPGRMMRYDIGGVRILLDYAHNPDGLRGFLAVAQQVRGNSGRFALLLGHAGNRQDADIEELARVAAQSRPDLVVIKEIPTHLRGRALGEIPRIIHGALLSAGVPEASMVTHNSEFGAAEQALNWAHPGDVVGLLVHGPDARAAVLAMLADRLERERPAGAIGTS
jgi:UDP-N-acetylmuramyl tripeptide synthase